MIADNRDNCDHISVDYETYARLTPDPMSAQQIYPLSWLPTTSVRLGLISMCG